MKDDCSVTGESSERKLAILSLHKVGDPSPGGWETWYYVPEPEFAAHLTYLRDNNWHVIDMATLLRALTEPSCLPARAALLTFDDGYRSTLDVALPLLLQFGYPAVVFVPTACVGMGSHSFDTNSREPDEPLCTWDELRELQRCGVSVQSHGATHRAFSTLTLAEQEEEMVRSKAVLEFELNKPVEMFCYPYGDGGTNPQQVGRMLKRSGYKAACLYDGLLAQLPITDPNRLSRLFIGRGSDLHTELAPHRSTSVNARLDV
jgi:peptidoglycan/xylan/chitin deacetylase (PgdA/CDA1 family)